MSSPEPIEDAPAGRPELAGFRELREWLQTKILPVLRLMRSRWPVRVRVELPALTAGTPAVVAVTWPEELPVNTYGVLATPEVPAALARLLVAGRLGSRTTTGYELLVTSPVDAPAGAGFVLVVAIM